jgi:uncharacterized protein (TIGR02145 family)
MKTNLFFLSSAIFVAMPFMFFACSSKIDDGEPEPNYNVINSLGVPTNVTATLNANNSIIVSWSLVRGASEYIVFRCSENNTSGYSSNYCGNYVQIGSVVNDTLYKDASLQNGMKYYYQIAARFQNSELVGGRSEIAYATTSSYTGDFGTVTHGGKTYRTVRINTQNWMAENLNHDGGGGCYDYDCEKYGRLYDWATAMDLGNCNNKSCLENIQANHRGICPSGWHIPTSDDWKTLINFVGTTENAGLYLKAESGWGINYNNSSGNGENKYGFAALPGGYGDLIGGFSNVGIQGVWWSANENTSYPDMAIGLYINKNGNNMPNNSYNKRYEFSVRCVENADVSGYCFYNNSCTPMLLSQCNSNNGTLYPSSSICDSNIPKCNNVAYNLATHYCKNNGSEITEYGTVSDGTKTYKTVIIDDKEWMAENLNTAVNGSKCGSGFDPENGSQVLTNENTVNCDRYGRLYDWTTVMQGSASSDANPSGVRGVCPEGWHLPSASEWGAMESYVGGGENAGTKLMARSGWGTGNNGTNAYGFAALPGGYGAGYSFFYEGFRGAWWTSTSPYYRMIGSGEGISTLSDEYNGNEGFYSVRCVKI